MPEGPELHCSAKYINRVCEGRLFSGKVVKSEVSTKNPDVPWDTLYKIAATSRGKEIKLTLTDGVVSEGTAGKESKEAKQKDAGSTQTLDIVVRFGMSGKFCFTPVGEMHKHSHLTFFTADGQDALSFVDYRRFGRWEITSKWGPARGPCVLTEQHILRDHVLSKLDSRVFSKPICEALLDQSYFNGIGNYLRAEILYRAGIPPFVSARSVLLELKTVHDANVKVKREKPDIIDLCHTVALEVVKLNEGIEGFRYGPKEDEEGMSAFTSWLQCYYQPGMRNMVDHNGRTIWFKGEAGPLAPTGQKSRGRMNISKLTKKSDGEQEDEESSAKKAKITRSKVKKLASKSVGKPRGRKQSSTIYPEKVEGEAIHLSKKAGKRKHVESHQNAQTATASNISKSRTKSARSSKSGANNKTSFVLALSGSRRSTRSNTKL